jgi:Type III restriction enzyme, res subunit
MSYEVSVGTADASDDVAVMEREVDAVPAAALDADSEPPATADMGEVILMADFIAQFGDGLLDSIKSLNPPVYDGAANAERDQLINGLSRAPFPAQRELIQTACASLVDRDDPAVVLNGEMGTGKTLMAVATAAAMHDEGFTRTLVIAPPHLVYKWRREIKTTVPGARVWILNGPDTLRKLLQIRAMRAKPTVPEFFVLGRVRMRLGFNWKPVCTTRKVMEEGETHTYAACADCGTVLTRPTEDGEDLPMSLEIAKLNLSTQRSKCHKCNAALWSLVHKGQAMRDRRELVMDALQQMPTIGPKKAAQLVATFGEELLSSMLEDNVYEFVNLMGADGDHIFTDRQAARMERALATFEFSLGTGGYQATEFIKRYLPHGYFGLLVVDEGHEYKNDGSAQGQAMGVLARKCRKTLLLTGTLMGGYADDLFHLLWRINPKAMLEDGFKPSQTGSMSGASMSFMREHGVLKDIYKETSRTSHKTAKGSSISHRVAKAPGFGPKGIMRFVLPCTAFLRLKDIGANVLPPYQEFFTDVAMTEPQGEAYRKMAASLSRELREALRKGDTSLLGVVLNVLLAWPDCAFRDELVRHPRTRSQLLFQGAIFKEGDVSPKEAALVALCKAQKALHRRILAYTVYTGTRDTTARLKTILEAQGLKVAVLRASVDAAKREDWVAEQVDRGIDVLITNPELVKTGLDMLEFPTIAFMQSGFNVYTLQQASRRSWRIGQKHPVEVHFLGYAGSAQMDCLRLMAKKIAVSQSTSGDMPDSGLDVLNQGGDSIEVALAKQLIA